MSQLENAQVEAALGCFEGSYNELTSASCMVVVTSQRLLAVLARHVHQHARGNESHHAYNMLTHLTVEYHSMSVMLPEH